MIKKRKILVHTCCAACASHVFKDLLRDNFEIIAFFYNPQAHGLAEYKRRLHDVKTLSSEMMISLIVPKYSVSEFFTPLIPYQDKKSIKYISDPNRYKRKRCNLCINLLVSNMIKEAKKLHLRYFSTTLLCSPYKDHNEIWDSASEAAAKNKISLYYKDFRKGYWMGRNFARKQGMSIPAYCGCNDSLEEGRLE